VASGPREQDQVIDEGEVRVFISPTVAPALDGKVLDARVSEDHVQFMIGPPDDQQAEQDQQGQPGRGEVDALKQEWLTDWPPVPKQANRQAQPGMGWLLFLARDLPETMPHFPRRAWASRTYGSMTVCALVWTAPAWVRVSPR
jgi:hypothetical protein